MAWRAGEHAQPRRAVSWPEGEKDGRYVIVTPINSLYATDEIFGPAGVGAFERILTSSVKERVWRAIF